MFVYPVGSASNPHFVGEKMGKKMIGDRTANGWSNYYDKKKRLGGEHWTDARLGVLLEDRTRGPGFESVQRLVNIEERDPDPKLFEIPEGYSVLNCVPSGRGRSAVRPAQCEPVPRGPLGAK
jgi:hypothetical protein